ncbi:MAG TPA: hypothetical protein VGO57_18010 [Verrucomicrobiae bacterium]|jgi:hypothetical protein
MNRIILIGCGKVKLAESSAAKDLYVGHLFVARRQYAERSGHPWLIVSALHGLLVPEKVIAPYNKTMPTQRHAFTRWADKFRDQFTSAFECSPMVLEVHAGADYVTPIRLALWSWSCVTIEHPVFGMGIGEQIAFYNSQL